MKNTIYVLLAVAVFSLLSFAPKTILPIVVVSTNTTLTSANHVVINTGGVITLTLPSAAGNSGLVLIIANHGTGQVMLSAPVMISNTETLSAITYNLGGNLVSIISDGTNWRLISQ